MHSNHNFACSILIWVLAVGVALLMADVQVGAQIAFTSYRDGNREIYVMDADGGNPQNLTSSDGFDSSPSWSPSGERIAFSSRRNRAQFDIYVMDVDGGNLQRLTRDAESDYSPDWVALRVLGFSRRQATDNLGMPQRVGLQRNIIRRRFSDGLR